MTHIIIIIMNFSPHLVGVDITIERREDTVDQEELPISQEIGTEPDPVPKAKSKPRKVFSPSEYL